MQINVSHSYFVLQYSLAEHHSMLHQPDTIELEYH